MWCFFAFNSSCWMESQVNVLNKMKNLVLGSSVKAQQAEKK